MKGFVEEDFNQRNNYARTETVENEDFINFFAPPSLQSIAVVSTVTRLWTDPDVVMCLQEIFSTYDDTDDCGVSIIPNRSLQKVEELMLQKVREMYLPELIKRMLSQVIKPTGRQLMDWFLECNEQLPNRRDLQTEIKFVSWTMKGVIDKTKTIQSISKNKTQLTTLNNSKLFFLACNYCLEEIIRDLWNPTFDYNTFNCMDEYDKHLLAYWIHFLDNKMPSFSSIVYITDESNIYSREFSDHQNIISLCCRTGNAIAFRYFWSKLTQQEINTNLVRWFGLIIKLVESVLNICSQYQEYRGSTDIMCVLLSHAINQTTNTSATNQSVYENIQKELFPVYSEEILTALFTHWPFQMFFIPIFKMSWKYLSKTSYCSIMVAVGLEITQDTSALLKDMLLVCPHNFRKHFQRLLLRKKNAAIILNLINEYENEMMDLLLKDVSAVRRRKIIWNMLEHPKFYSMVSSDKVVPINDFMWKYLSSDRDIYLFKQDAIFKYAQTSLFENKLSTEMEKQLLNWACEFLWKIRHFKNVGRKPIEIYVVLIQLGHYEYVDQFMSCCFTNEDDVKAFKLSLIHPDNANYADKIMYGFIFQNTNISKNFDTFIEYNFTSIQDINQFKRILQEKTKELFLIQDSLNQKNVSLLEYIIANCRRLAMETSLSYSCNDIE